MEENKMTNEEKAKEVAMVWRAYGFPYETIYKIVLESMQWKDEQHKQELIRIYNFVSPYLTPEADSDLKIIIGLH